MPSGSVVLLLPSVQVRISVWTPFSFRILKTLLSCHLNSVFWFSQDIVFWFLGLRCGLWLSRGSLSNRLLTLLLWNFTGRLLVEGLSHCAGSLVACSIWQLVLFSSRIASWLCFYYFLSLKKTFLLAGYWTYWIFSFFIHEFFFSFFFFLHIFFFLMFSFCDG